LLQECKLTASDNRAGVELDSFKPTMGRNVVNNFVESLGVYRLQPSTCSVLVFYNCGVATISFFFCVAFFLASVKLPLGVSDAFFWGGEKVKLSTSNTCDSFIVGFEVQYASDIRNETMGKFALFAGPCTSETEDCKAPMDVIPGTYYICYANDVDLNYLLAQPTTQLTIFPVPVAEAIFAGRSGDNINLVFKPMANKGKFDGTERFKFLKQVGFLNENFCGFCNVVSRY